MKNIKSILLFTILIFAVNIIAQDDYDEDYIMKDPGNVVSTNAELAQTLSSFNLSDKNIGIGSETKISGNMKYFTIPLHYKLPNATEWMINAYIPIIYQKKQYGEVGRGIGDMTIGTAYFQNKTLEEGLIMNASVDITLPTGNDAKEVGNQTIALGGGSFGFVGSFSTHVMLGGGILHSSINYNYNTFNKTTTNPSDFIEFERRVRAPGILSLSSSYVYNIIDDLYLSGALIYNYLGEGYTESTTTTTIPNIPETVITTIGTAYPQTIYYLDLSFETEYKFEAEKFSAVSLILNSVYLKFKIPILCSDFITSRNPVFTMGIRKNF